ncbi:MAG: hypothetical protein MUP81_06305 [Dehalococcoidia bacterium]|nr:hypothetical protein [Dehalococcoidia bacterium]
MKCKSCHKKLHRIHLNKKKDLDLCLNIDCSLYRQPQKYTGNPRNKKLFTEVDREKYLWKTGGREQKSQDRPSLIGETYTLHLPHHNVEY